MIILNKKFKRVQKTKKRYILITGGRGSAKSFGISTLLVILMHVSRHIILFARYTMISAKDSIIPEFEEKIEMMQEHEHFDILSKDITEIHTGSKILFRGIKTSSGKQTAKLKGIKGLTTLVVDEAEEFTDEDDFDKIDGSIRKKGVRNRVILIMNPTTKNHWIYKRWFEGHLSYEIIDGHKIPISNHPDIEHIHFTYLDNEKNLSRSFLKNIHNLKLNNTKKYVHRFLGAWVDKAEGVIFENWEVGKFDDYYGTICGIDYGYFPDPFALVRISIDSINKILYVQELAYGTEYTNEDVLKLIGANCSKSELIIADTNEPRTTEMISESGFNIEKAKKGNGSVAQDIRDIQDYKIVVTEDSQNIIIELNNYAWNNKKASMPIGEYDHAIAAIRYAFRKTVGDYDDRSVSWVGSSF